MEGEGCLSTNFTDWIDLSWVTTYRDLREFLGGKSCHTNLLEDSLEGLVDVSGLEALGEGVAP